MFLTEKPPPLNVSAGGGSMSHGYKLYVNGKEYDGNSSTGERIEVVVTEGSGHGGMEPPTGGHG